MTSSCFCGDSGGHFNPAVSLAAMLVGGLNLTMLLPYWVSQLCGGLLGASLAKVGDPLGGVGAAGGRVGLSNSPVSSSGTGWALLYSGRDTGSPQTHPFSPRLLSSLSWCCHGPEAGFLDPTALQPRGPPCPLKGLLMG